MRYKKFMLAAFSVLMSFSSAQALDFYLSPTGSDSNPGTQQLPIRTLNRARAFAQYHQKTLHRREDIRFHLMSGVYHSQSPITFGPEDSALPGTRISFQALPGARPRLVGGLVTRLNWQRISGSDIWVTKINPFNYLPAKDRNGSSVSNPVFRDLYVDGARAIRARIPKLHPGRPDLSYVVTASWVRPVSATSPTYPTIPRHIEGIDVAQSFRKSYHPVFGAADCNNASRRHPVEFVSQQHWQQSYYRIGGIYEGSNLISIYPCAQEYKIASAGLGDALLVQNSPFHLENSLDFLTDENEWFYDAETENLYYKPKAGKDPNRSEIMIPTMETIIRIQGKSGQPVSGLSFSGLIFENTTYFGPNQKGFINMQGTVACESGCTYGYQQSYLPGAVTVSQARDISFIANVFRNTGADALQFATETAQSLVSKNQIYSAGGSCISLGLNPAGVATSFGDKISGNAIWSCGQRFAGSPAIFAQWPQDLLVSENLIRYVPYTGISVGWGWNYAGQSKMKNNRILNNRIFNYHQLLFDGGGIYTLGYQPGSDIAGNQIGGVFPVKIPGYAGATQPAGIYLDQGSSGIIVRNNMLRMVMPMDGNQNKMIYHHTCYKTNWVTNNWINNSFSNWSGIDAESWRGGASWSLISPPTDVIDLASCPQDSR